MAVYIPKHTPVSMMALAEDALHVELQDRMVPLFVEVGGDDWVAILNNQREDKYKEKGYLRYQKIICKEAEHYNWDFTEIVSSLRDNIKHFNIIKSNKENISELCDKILQFRNQRSHKTPASMSPDYAARQIEVCISLAKALDIRKECTENLKMILAHVEDGFPSLPAALTDQPQTATLSASAEEKLNELHVKVEQLLNHAEREAVKSRQPAEPKPNAESLPEQGAAAKQRAFKPWVPPEAEPGVTLFPMVMEGTGAEAAFGSFSCRTFTPQHQSNLHATVIGFGGKRSDTFYQAIDEARCTETDIPLAMLHTYTRVDGGDFVGASFSLAAAVADRGARYGLTPTYEHRHIIATGILTPGRRGDIGVIDSFAEKLVLIERSAPPNALFVFPKGNLDQADAQTVALLRKLESGGRIETRAISHFAELEGIFGAGQTQSPPAAQGSPATANDVGAQQATPNGRVGAISKGRKSFLGLSPVGLFLGSVIGGGLLLGFLYLAANHSSAPSDPLLVQGGDERLNELARLGAGLRGPIASAAACAELAQAAAALTTSDRGRMAQPHREAMSAADRCAQELRASDTRWEALRLAEFNFRTLSGVLPDVVANARRALTTFDLSRTTEDGKQALLARSESAVAAVAESDRRLASLADALRGWRSHASANAMAHVLELLGTITQPDRRRATGDAAAALSGAQSVMEERDRSDQRLAATVSAAEGLRVSDGAAARDAAERAVAQLTPLDRERATAAQRMAIDAASRLPTESRLREYARAINAFTREDSASNASSLIAAFQALRPDDRLQLRQEHAQGEALVRGAERRMAESALRMENLARAARELDMAERSNTAIGDAQRRLLQAATSLTEFDRARLSGSDRLTLARAAQVGRDVEMSDGRIAAAVRLATLTAAARGAPSPNIVDGLQRARASLTALDYERMTLDQRSIIDRACGPRAQLPPGALAPIAGTECLTATFSIDPPAMEPLMRIMPR